MIPDPVENHVQIAPVRFLDETVERLERAETRLDAAVVADVVSELAER
jgi:hypothetical protein